MAEKMPPLMPYFQVRDPRATLAWFQKLGFTSAGELTGPDGAIQHAEVVRGPLRFMFGPAMGDVGSVGLSLYVTLDESVDAYHDAVTAAGIAVAEPLTDQFWGDRTFTVDHPDGYRIQFAQHVRDVSMEEMAAHAAQTAAPSA
jgi:PhnB protein